MADQPAELTLSELARAYVVATPYASGDQRMKKWLKAATAMLEHGQAPATANRELSNLVTATAGPSSSA